MNNKGATALPVVFGIVGLGLGVVAAFFSTRRTWLGDASPGEWIGHLGELNAVPSLVAYSLIGLAVGVGIGLAMRRKA
jgi:hypothetical protein